MSKIAYKDIAPGAADAAGVTTESASLFSTPNDILNGKTVPAYATLEFNQWALTGTKKSYSGEMVAFWSAEMSGEDGYFSNPPVITVTLSDLFSSTGITLSFDTAAGDYCSEVEIAWYKDDEALADVKFQPTAPVYFCSNSVEGYNKIVLTMTRTSMPFRYAKLTRFEFGSIREFGMEKLRSAYLTQDLHPISLELPIDSMTWTLEDSDDIDYIFQLKQPVEVYNGDTLLAVYYINKSSRSAKHRYKIDCIDAIGVLDDSPFVGGVYTDYSAKQLIEDIVDGAFSVAFEVDDVALSGAIFPGTKRTALQQVLFALGACASSSGYEIRVFSLDTVLAEVEEDRTYSGAAVETSAVVTAVEVASHTYTQDEAGGVEIGGAKYRDEVATYTVTNPNATANDKANIKTVTDATLISPDIAQAAAQRVYDYYSMRKKVTAKIVLKGEVVGDYVAVPNPWAGTTAGNITKMEITLSNTVAANITLVGA